MYWYCLLGLAIVLALVHIVPSLMSLLYIHLGFHRYLRQHQGPLPKVALFVPCKGLSPGLAQNLEALARQEYKHFNVTYISESVEDPANEAIEGVVRRYPHCRHVVAGLATCNGQKNHNLLKAIETDVGSDVYAFCDSDVRPAPNWLSMLVGTLCSDDVAAATGTMWITPKQPKLGATLHSMMAAFQAMLLSIDPLRGVWGGGMAMRSQTFERLDVAKTWQHTVVDDVTVDRLLRDTKAAKRYDPRCLTVTQEAAASVREAIVWFTRQILYTKFYLRPLWLVALVAFVPSSLLMIAALPLAIAGLFVGSLAPAGLICLGFSLVSMLSNTTVKLICRDGQRALRWFLLAPLAEWLSTYCLVKTVFMRTLRWGDVAYRLDRAGRVVNLERLDEA